jgi:hypothetical protein
MSTSIRSQAVAAVVIALATDPSPATGGTWRARTEQFTQDESPAFNVWPIDEKYSEDANDRDTLAVTLSLRVQCLVRSGAEVDLAAELLAVFAHQQIMADETLGGIVQDARLTGSKWTIAEGGQDVVALDLDFDVMYQISRADPTVNQFYQSS